MQQMTNTHVKRWKRHFGETGYGHLYQGRFKSFPIQTDDHFYQVVRYVERNALRANLVQEAEQWPWSSLAQRSRSDANFSMLRKTILGAWPLARPSDWNDIVSLPQTEAELISLRRCVNRGCPFGDSDWTSTTANQLGLESTLRQRGRPKHR
jgi:putative transposase